MDIWNLSPDEKFGSTKLDLSKENSVSMIVLNNQLSCFDQAQKGGFHQYTSNHFSPYPLQTNFDTTH